MSGKGYISKEEDRICEFCKKVAETRPYGPKDERICYDCSMKDQKTSELKMAKYLGLSNE